MHKATAPTPVLRSLRLAQGRLVVKFNMPTDRGYKMAGRGGTARAARRLDRVVYPPAPGALFQDRHIPARRQHYVGPGDFFSPLYCLGDALHARSSHVAGFQRTSWKEPTADCREYDGIEERSKFVVEGAIDENRLGWVDPQCSRSKVRAHAWWATAKSRHRSPEQMRGFLDEQ